MAKRLQLRKGTTAEHSTFTGAVAEVTVDTTKDTVVVHDGVTVGGFPLVKEELVFNEGPEGLANYHDFGSAAFMDIEGIQYPTKDTPLLLDLKAWSDEYLAEVLRGLGQSGIFMTRPYNFFGNEAYNRPFDTNFNPLAIHNHPDYEGMAGMAEWSAIINGYYIRARHTDYLLRSATANYLETVNIPAPAVPVAVSGAGDVAAQVEAAKALFDEYINGGFPEGFAWTLSYIEFWFENFTNDVEDSFASFRHQQEVSNLGDALRRILKFNYSGTKNRLENDTFEAPVIRTMDANGVVTFARLRYRVIAKDVTTVLGSSESQKDLRNAIENVDDWKLAARNRSQTRYKVTETSSGLSNLDRLMYSIPGFDGPGANLTEVMSQNGPDANKVFGSETVLNAAYYNRKYRLGTNDAAGRQDSTRGFNDPMLFVARTTKTEVAAITDTDGSHRYTFAIPLELILRTFLETWNPYEIPNLSYGAITGSGTIGSPYNGWNINFYNYKVPTLFFGAIEGQDPADTIGGAKYSTAGNSDIVTVVPSGIYVNLPPITTESGTYAVKLRYPVYPVFHEGTHAFAEVQAAKKIIGERIDDLGTVYASKIYLDSEITEVASTPMEALPLGIYPVTLTGAYTVTRDDSGKCLLSEGYDITLPELANIPLVWSIRVKNTHISTAITVGSFTVNAGNSVLIIRNNETYITV